MNVTKKVGGCMIIQKFGGIAMKDEQMRAKCIVHIKEGLKNNGEVVVVVSAIGRRKDPYSTDSLLQLTEAFASAKKARDLAASCGEIIASAVLSAELERAGIQNTILHGNRTGILTAGEFGDGSIVEIDSAAILAGLDIIDCIIIPGFQGVTGNGEVMTLGRGGSDLTAIALAAVLGASHVEFFKDVPGVMTGDPNKGDHFHKLDFLKFDQFIDLLDCERPIIQKRAALHAIKKSIPLYIRGIDGTESGTWITP